METGVECETFHRLEDFLGTERFLKKLTEQQSSKQQPEHPLCTVSAPAPQLASQDPSLVANVSNISELIEHAMSTSITGSGPESLALVSRPVPRPVPFNISTPTAAQDSELDYVLIDKQSAVEAMAFFIAETLIKCPQAFQMSPVKLQEAIIITIKGMKQSRFKRVCTAGRHAYRWSALGYSAFQMYSNPWICQAIIQALWTFSRMTMRSWV